MHISIKLDKPVEFVNVESINPLISKCEIKVCYVGDEPNRNRSIITKEVAKDLANSLPGSPIVGYYNDEKQDFEEHNRMIDISNGKFEIKDTTRPYGFVSTDAKVWFQWFQDDGVDHEYLMTEGYLWTGQYPECKRVVDKGNNQSMELDQNNLSAYWTKDNKGKPEFFIINEAIMSKLCILGEDVEPCFEGASISAVQFSFDSSFSENWTNMMNQMKEILNEGGAPVFKYTVNADSDKTQLENYLSNQEDKYGLVECYKEEDQNFAILQKDETFFRMNYSYDNDELVAEEPFAVEYSYEHGYETVRVVEMVETSSCVYDDEGHCVEERVISTVEKVTSASGPIQEEVAVQEEVFSAQENDEKVVEENVLEEEPVAAQVEEPVIEVAEVTEGVQEVAENPVEEVPAEQTFTAEEYNALNDKYSQVENDYNAALGLIAELKHEKENLQSQFNELQTKYESLENVNTELNEKVASLSEFKVSVDREKKQQLIAKFYMLDDADKKDVIENIDNYALDDIEAKLCVACFRNHVNFDGLNDDEQTNHASAAAPIVYNLGGNDDGEDLGDPDWVKAVRAKEKSLNN